MNRKKLKALKLYTRNLRNREFIIIAVIITFLVICTIMFSIEPIRRGIITLLKKEEIIKNIGYEVYSNENNKIRILLKFTDTENGIEEIRLPDGDKVIANGRNEIGMDYVIEADGEYTFVSKSTTGEEITETINVNEEYRKNLIGIEKIQEISTEQDYSITKKYDGESPYTYYYAIGENNTEWIEIPEYKIVNVDSYKVNELNWKNEDGTVTLKVKKVGTAGNTVEVKRVIDDLNEQGIEFNEEEKVIEGESIIACVRDNELESGNYRLKVNGEEYPAEIYNYDDENVNYLTDKNLGTKEADNRMLIMKYKGNLNVNKERKITAETRKKGMFLYVTEELINNGEISMTARGANAEGQDVYLWKYESGVYEYVPVLGATGGVAVGAVSKNNSSYVTNGTKGNNGINRQAGGGGSGLAVATGYYNTSMGSTIQKTATAVSGSGATGTSYSGGTGGGSGNIRKGYSYTTGELTYGTNGSEGQANGGAGGNGYNGGTGNPGGTGSIDGANGTGGLLIVYTNKLNNNSKINSNGVDSIGNGGASGGGSVNIFYDELINEGTTEAIGGNSGGGGNGGNGSVTIQKLTTNIVGYATLTLNGIIGAEGEIKPDALGNNAFDGDKNTYEDCNDQTPAKYGFTKILLLHPSVIGKKLIVSGKFYAGGIVFRDKNKEVITTESIEYDATFVNYGVYNGCYLRYDNLDISVIIPEGAIEVVMVDGSSFEDVDSISVSEITIE